MLKMCILKELASEPKSGYALLHDLARYFGGKKPSAGTIYPLLKDLLAENLTSCKQRGRSKIYALTPQGTKLLKALVRKNETMLHHKLELIRACMPRSSRKLLALPLTGNRWIESNCAVLGELQHEILHLISQPFDEKKSEKWHKYLRNAIKEVKSLQ